MYCFHFLLQVLFLLFLITNYNFVEEALFLRR